MEPERWQEIEQLYHAALELRGQRRAAFLERSLRRLTTNCAAKWNRCWRVTRQRAALSKRRRWKWQRRRWPTNPSLLAMDKDCLKSGAMISHYQILEKLGAGGMGEVYRARDTKLNRDVALKILPGQFADDPERLSRFRREAQVLASLNHPNIAAIYGLEESGDTRALVIELVEGPPLAERICAVTPGAVREPPLPLDEALTIAKQIAEALEAAHEQGIIHRDLKPANVKVRPDGTVKVLDFGLAKLAPNVGAIHESPSPDSVTATTRAGAIMGTAAYMSPEQVRGQAVDRRADIWAFGCVLFEMLTAQRAFAGGTFSDTLAAVLKTEPHWSALPETTPVPIQRLVRRCLTKDPKQRLRDIGEARIAIEETISGDVGAIHELPLQVVGATLPLQPWRRALPWAVAALLLIATVALTVAYLRIARSPTTAVISQIPPPAETSFGRSLAETAQPQLSPDGRRLVFLANGPKVKPFLWVRSLDSTEAKPLEGTEGARLPFWSPDGRYIGFFADRKLMKIEVSGGPPVNVCDAVLGQGGSWAPDGTILFAPSATSPLYRVSAGGGQPVPVTVLDQSRQEASHFWPQFLPDKRHFLFYSDSLSADFSGTYVGSLEGGKPVLLLRGRSNAVYAPPGYLMFAQDGKLMAQSFDPRRFELTGDPASIAQPSEAFPDTSVLEPNRFSEWHPGLHDRNGRSRPAIAVV